MGGEPKSTTDEKKAVKVNIPTAEKKNHCQWCSNKGHAIQECTSGVKKPKIKNTKLGDA